jgi:hypothetical protein
VHHRLQLDPTEGEEFIKTSGMGLMAQYRQRQLDHIQTHYDNGDHSHMLVVDLDLFLPLSTLGILHTLGKRPDNPVAS